MEKIVISTEETASAEDLRSPSSPAEPRLPSVIPAWGRVALFPLVLILPALCLIALILRIAVRNLPPRVRFAWLSYFNTLLIVSGLLTSVAAVIGLTTAPTPLQISQGLSDLDDRASFPKLPSPVTMSPQLVSQELKPLVVVISPSQQTWFNRQDVPSSSMGAGILLYADSGGYLIATARHVVDSVAETRDKGLLVAGESGVWSSASLVAKHNQLDLSLLWLKRTAGTSSFAIPIDSGKDVRDGDTIYVIGHPQGLRYTLSTGIIARADKDVFQLSAPVSPGNSGGPMFDDKGGLAGIVIAMVDKNRNPNSENLNFAVRAEALLDSSGWTFYRDGRKHLDDFIRAEKLRP